MIGISFYRAAALYNLSALKRAVSRYTAVKPVPNANSQSQKPNLAKIPKSSPKTNIMEAATRSITHYMYQLTTASLNLVILRDEIVPTAEMNGCVKRMAYIIQYENGGLFLPESELLLPKIIMNMPISVIRIIIISNRRTCSFKIAHARMTTTMGAMFVTIEISVAGINFVTEYLIRFVLIEEKVFKQSGAALRH